MTATGAVAAARYRDLAGKVAVVTGGSRGIGAADIVAAFAGGNRVPVPTTEETAAHWREVIESNLTSTFLTTQAFLPAMIERHHGSIITMSSEAARQATPANSAYAAAKAGIIAFSRHVAHEVAPGGIRVNCVVPSTIENERIRAWTTEQQRRELAGAFPLGRIGQPEDVAAATLFLASDASSWITGITLDIAGGKIML